MLIATDYEILRNVKADGRSIGTPVRGKPVRVATLINEEKFLETGAALIHHQTVFFEDKMHDWDYLNGRLRYYTRVAEEADVVVVYETKEIRGLYCPNCGKRVHPVNECICPTKD